jgi:hypothetical protein
VQSTSTIIARDVFLREFMENKTLPPNEMLREVDLDEVEHFQLVGRHLPLISL